MNADAGIVCSAYCGALPTPLNKKWAIQKILVYVEKKIYLNHLLPESPMNAFPVSEKVSEYPIKYH